MKDVMIWPIYLDADKSLNEGRKISKEYAISEPRIKEIISEDADLLRNCEIITSIPGVGIQNAVCLIVYTDNFCRFDYNSRKIACYYGVAPFGRQSGTSVNTPPHVSPFANRLIKALLSQAALASIHFCPQMATYYQDSAQNSGYPSSMLNSRCNVHQQYQDLQTE